MNNVILNSIFLGGISNCNSYENIKNLQKCLSWMKRQICFASLIKILHAANGFVSFFTLCHSIELENRGRWIRNVYIPTCGAKDKSQCTLSASNYCWCKWRKDEKHLHSYYIFNDSLIIEAIQRMYNIMTMNTKDLFLNILIISI